MIGKVYKNADDTYRARVWQRSDGRWDFEVVRRWPKGGWGVVVGPAIDGDITYETEERANLYAGDYLNARCIEELTRLEVDELTSGWAPVPPPYKAPAGAPEIKIGQLWRKGRQITRVLDVRPGTDGLRITTMNVVSARPSTGAMIRDRKPAEWAYNERDFRAKFKPDEGPKLIRKRDDRPIELNRAGEPAWLTGCPECGLSGGCDCDEADTPPVSRSPQKRRNTPRRR